MNKPSPQNELTNHETISWLAYQLWTYAGRPEGRAVEFWLQAERLAGIGQPESKPGAPNGNGAAHNGSPQPAKPLQDATPPRGKNSEPELARPRTIKPAKRGSLKGA